MKRFNKHKCLIACFGIITCHILVADSLPPSLGDWSPVVRAASIPKVASRGAAALPDLLAALDSPNSGLRHASTEAIAIIAKKDASKAAPEWKNISAKLITLLQKDTDFWVRCGAASALKSMRDPAAAPALVKAATDPNPWVAAAALDAIQAMPVKFFDPSQYLATAVVSLKAPRSATRSSAIAMIGSLGPDGKKALPQVEASVATYSQDSMFCDRPRIEAIIWISKFDRRKAATLAAGLLKEERWGAAGRYARILPFLQSLGPDAAPAADALRDVSKQTRDKASAVKAQKILTNLKS